jgi:23S rRNA pseudouridine2605 synthase
VEGRRITAPGKIYLMLNKPRGAVTTASDEKGRKTVYDSLDADLPWVGPVGRLDKASEGLLLLTNDSNWAARVLAPETHLDKTYHVQIAAVADEVLLAVLTRGVRSDEGGVLRAKTAKLLRSGNKNCWLEIVLDEGKNRHLRRLLEALVVSVLRLMRVAVGPLRLGNLPKGQFRMLAQDEVQALAAPRHD